MLEHGLCRQPDLGVGARLQVHGKNGLEIFRRSIEKVAALPCDIVLSPHPSFTQVDAKLKRRAEMKGQGTDPFIDANGCKAYAADGMKRLEARRAEESKPGY